MSGLWIDAEIVNHFNGLKTNTVYKSIAMGLSLLKMDEMQLELCQLIAKKCWSIVKRKARNRDTTAQMHTD
jgi:hypothetical protein